MFDNRLIDKLIFLILIYFDINIMRKSLKYDSLFLVHVGSFYSN